MSSRSWQLRIQDILDAVARIQRQTENVSFNQFEEDDTLASAVLYHFMIIGEAATQVDVAVKQRYPQIPWRLMGDMRNWLVHQYFRVKLSVVWRTIQDDLPPLVSQLEVVLQEDAEGQA